MRTANLLNSLLTALARLKKSTRFAIPGLCQIVASISNFLVPLTASRWLDSAELGTVVLMYGGTQVASQILRSGIAESFMLVRSRDGTDSFEWLCVPVFVLASSVGFASIRIFSDLTLAVSAAVAVSLAGALTTELLKFSFLHQRRTMRALSVDSSWLILQLAFYASALYFDRISTSTVLIGWGAASIAASLPWAREALKGFTFQRFVRFLPQANGKFFVDGALGSLAPYLMLSLAATYGTSAAVGEYRSATIVFLPLQLLVTALSTALFSNATEASRTVRILKASCALLLLYIGATVIVVSAVPEHIGAAVLGEAWPYARSQTTLAGLLMASYLAMQLAIVERKLRSDPNAMLRMRSLYATVLTIGAILLQVDSATKILALSIAAHCCAAVFWLFNRSFWRRRSTSHIDLGSQLNS